MNILTVADFFYPGVTGGASIVIYETMRRLFERGHQVTILTRGQQDIHTYIEGMRVQFYKVPSREILYPLAIRRCQKTLTRLLEEQPYDLINLHHTFSGLAAELIRPKFGNLPSVFYFHGPWHKEAMVKDGLLFKVNGVPDGGLPLKYRLRRNADNFVLKACTQIVGLSDYMLREAVSIWPGAKDKYRKIPGGVDTIRFKPAVDRRQVRRTLGLSEDGKVLLTVRRLSPRMGLENLVKAMARVEERRKDVVLLIGGEGELRDSLTQLIANLGLRRTSLIGYVNDQDLPAYYQGSDMFIMPSLALEGFGLATLEALACGVPVLGTPTGGTPEILERILPDFIAPGVEADGLAECILDRLAHLPDPAMSVKVRNFAKQFDWQYITNLVENLFEDLTQKPS